MNLKNKILEEYKNGNIIVAGNKTLQVMKLDEFIKQDIDGMLYDLNRNEQVVLTFLDDPKWINDYAVSKVIRALKERIDELENAAPDKTPIENLIKYLEENYNFPPEAEYEFKKALNYKNKI